MMGRANALFHQYWVRCLLLLDKFGSEIVIVHWLENVLNIAWKIVSRW